MRKEVSQCDDFLVESRDGMSLHAFDQGPNPFTICLGNAPCAPLIDHPRDKYFLCLFQGDARTEIEDINDVDNFLRSYFAE